MEIKKAMIRAHTTATQKGWWESPRPLLEQLMLMVTELAEAAEEVRSGYAPYLTYFKGQKPEGFPIELAYVVIRVFDTCQHYGIDLESAIELKMDYNDTRPYRHGGKKA